MKFPGKWPGLALLFVAAIAGVWISLNPRDQASRPTGQASPEPIRKRTIQPDLAAERDTADAAARRQIEADWAELLRWLDSDPRPSPEEIRARLLETRAAWAAMDPQVLAESLDRLLKSGDDLATGLDFKVGLQGLLSGWPTLRVFLLDVLATSDPEMAAATAKRVLDETGSANEYATALRSLTRSGRGRADDSELLSHFGKMLDRPEWQRERGFAEALDLARFLGSAAAGARLAEWAGNPALKRRALDEFAADHPEQIPGILEASPTLDGGTRSQLMARADATDPAQLAAVDAYLRDPDLPPEEATALLKSFPLRSATTGFRLYGKTPAPYSRDQIAAGDRAALERVKQWAADPALADYHAEIQSLRQRLEQWTRQAEQSDARFPEN
jgi:hypothetical protein